MPSCPPSLALSADLEATVAAAELVLVVTPSHAFGDVLRRIAPVLAPGAGLAWATKGFDPPSGPFPA